jgi:murein DD-endopeptidase MepM/ murein hydrolase activator NlpD
VTPDPALVERIRHESDAVRAARLVDDSAEPFPDHLIWPVLGPISGVFGSQRVLNGEPRQPHLGTDIAAPAGAPVAAAASGVVTFAEHDLFLTGGTIIIEHGYGLSTTYAHLASVEVSVGQHLAQGERIGTVGATGRVTGPHLHWGADWYDVRLDPALLAGPMPQQNAAHEEKPLP